jgi:flagellar basal-body rod protein FlgG
LQGSFIVQTPPILQVDSSIPPAPRSLDELDLSDSDQAVMTALQTLEDNEATPQQLPSPVPVPAESVPDQPSETSDEKETLDSHAVRVVIEEELSGSSREERDIWYEELKSLPAGVVRDLLQVRKQLRALPRDLHRMDPQVTLPAPRVADVPAEPASQTRRQTHPDWQSTINSIEQSSNVARHNIANAGTPGFKRIRVTLVDDYGAWSQSDGDRPAELDSHPLQVEGVRLSTPVLDLTAGVLNPTKRPLDLAIDGDGFFVARRHETLVYTRCGALLLDAQRRICLAVADGSIPLEPAIVVPIEAREIQVAADGCVSVLMKPGVDPVKVGQLSLAQFPSPTRLRPIGGTLLSATQESGEPVQGAPNSDGRGAIQQGCLEQSNVDSDQELADIQRWQLLLKSFPTTSRPVTASGQDSRSR